MGRSRTVLGAVPVFAVAFALIAALALSAMGCKPMAGAAPEIPAGESGTVTDRRCYDYLRGGPCDESHSFEIRLDGSGDWYSLEYADWSACGIGDRYPDCAQSADAKEEK